MKLSSVRLQNFRCFEDTTIDFHEQLTVLVGGNGSGKTAVLDGTSNMLTYMKQETFIFNDVFNSDDLFRGSEGKMFGLRLSYIHNGEKLSVEAYYNLKQSKLFEERKDIYSMQRMLDGNTNQFQDGKTFAVHYIASRTISEKPEIDKNDLFKVTTKMGLGDNGIDFSAAISWFYAKAVEQAIERDNGDRDFVIPEFDAVRQAIITMLDGYENPRMMYTPSEFVIYKKGDPTTPYKLNQLSDGYRTMLALVMDLARRMAVVNAENYAATGKSVLESPAIVLIDEVELHLHPSWQQRVLPDLMRTFPNTQFIVTTHSPQVVSSVKPETVRILKDGKVLPPEYSTYGAESSRVLEEVFGVETRSPHNAAKQALDKYFRLINDGLYNTPEAQSLREELETWLYDDPALLRADMLIDRLESRKARERNNA